MTIKDVLDEFYRIWSTGDFSKVDEILTDDFEDYGSQLYISQAGGPKDRVIGREAFKKIVSTFREAVPDLKETPLRYSIDVENVVGMYHFLGNQVKSAEPLLPSATKHDFVAVDWFQVRDGKLCAWWWWH